MNRSPFIALSLIISCALVLPAHAVHPEIDGVRFERRYTDGELDLPLQGTGLFRYMGLFKAYAAAIYYEPDLDAGQLLGNRAKRIEVSYFHAFKGEDFGKATNKLIGRNVDAATLARIRPQIDHHNSLYRDVKPGDRYALTYVPGQGTELALNGETLGVIPGEAFAAALFAIWIGENPMNHDFKEQLLGLGEARR